MKLRDLLPWNWNWTKLVPWKQGSAGWLSRWTGGEPAGTLLLEADLPGVRPEDLVIEVRGDHLLVRARRQRERRWSNSRYSLVGRSWTGITRLLRLPEGVDPEGIEARLENGVLRVHGRLLPPEEPARIPVRAA